MWQHQVSCSLLKYVEILGAVKLHMWCLSIIINNYWLSLELPDSTHYGGLCVHTAFTTENCIDSAHYALLLNACDQNVM